jgi:acyl transferase domain-containing protein
MTAVALVAGSSVNQDGRSSSLTAPHGPSQQALITAAMVEAGVSVLGYVASHGTGTPLGDPIETGALRKAVAPPGADAAAGSFTVGAVKALTGHLEGTAGLAGLMLCQVQLEHQFAHALRYRYAFFLSNLLTFHLLTAFPFSLPFLPPFLQKHQPLCVQFF